MSERRKKFFHHLWSYIVINVILLIINLWTTPQYLWVIWVVLIWGLFMIIHSINAFDQND